MFTNVNNIIPGSVYLGIWYYDSNFVSFFPWTNIDIYTCIYVNYVLFCIPDK